MNITLLKSRYTHPSNKASPMPYIKGAISKFPVQNTSFGELISDVSTQQLRAIENSPNAPSPECVQQILDWSEIAEPVGILSRPPIDAVTIDTIIPCIRIENVTITDSHQLKVKTAAPGEPNYVLWRDHNGDAIEGRNAIWKDADIFVRIGPMSRKRCRNTGFTAIGLSVRFTIPAICWRGDNTWPVNSHEARLACQQVQARLAQIGVVVDLFAAGPCRVDICRNLILWEPCEVYMAVWDALHVSRTRYKRYPNGGQWFNGKQTISGYGKNARRAERGLSNQGLPPYVFRVEWEMKGAREVRHRLNAKTLDEVLDKWDTLPQVLHNHLKATIFKPSTTSPLRTGHRQVASRQAKSSANPIGNEIRKFRRWCGKRGAALPRPAAQIEKLVREGGAEAFRKILDAMPNLPRQQATRRMLLMKRAAFQEKMESDPDFARRYAELREKALAPPDAADDVQDSAVKRLRTVCGPLKLIKTCGYPGVSRPACYAAA